ncbi:unnamed protein product [Ilex paraguariensis]|uniref:Protein kinase domain-containing protein n=1 Tax=Ilex paraguariensis TaxID=185542 RepID=A0ABC8R190_9AQUA
MRNLRVLALSNNSLSGMIPPSIYNLSALTILSLAYNQLQGNIQPSKGMMLPHLQLLELQHSLFTGPLPFSVSNLTELESLQVYENNFTGKITINFGGLKKIWRVLLFYNNFGSGAPDEMNFINSMVNCSSLQQLELAVKGVFTNVSAISIFGNSRLCGGISELDLPRRTVKKMKERNMSLAHILITSVASTLVAITIVSSFTLFWLKKKRKSPSVGLLMEEPFLRMPYQRLLKATNGFSSENLIGEGSFGSVYKGMLDEEGLMVAIKVLNLQRHGASKSFMAECETLRNIRHRNLVKIISSCSSIDFQGNDFKALIYEFMPNGNLEKWLHLSREMKDRQDELPSLSLLQRINIAIDVACALNYLHNHCQNPIIHCDLKPSNILLENDMIARIGDFGLARFHPRLTCNVHSSSNIIRGTIGYTAPEPWTPLQLMQYVTNAKYGLGSEISTNGDVYSYGICLLEMMTGKRPTDQVFHEG